MESVQKDTMTIVVRFCAATSSARWTIRSLAVSSADVASSRSKICGSFISALAIARGEKKKKKKRVLDNL
jgi:hypothetical protein